MSWHLAHYILIGHFWEVKQGDGLPECLSHIASFLLVGSSPTDCNEVLSLPQRSKAGESVESYFDATVSDLAILAFCMLFQ